jgi:hypothetical protein
MTARIANDQELKDLVKTISDSEALVSELTQGFSFSELSSLVALAGDLPMLSSDGPLLVPEWEALDDAARNDLVQYVQATCKYPSNIAIESYVQKVLSAAVFASKLFQIFVPMSK